MRETCRTGAALDKISGAVARLSPAEQQHDGSGPAQSLPPPVSDDTIPPSVRRTAPATDLTTRAANFWPEDETADDINTFVARQRAADRR
jgi:hypothetical protein